ncbi:MAG: Rrf2 family transcriptional regulator [Candidatus Omnitrophota bacterium]
MRISAKCDYACKALLELTLHWPNREPVQIHTISENQKIPMRYLVQILIQLKNLGMVSSVRGKEGGYNLAASPNEIALGDLMRRVGGPLLPRADSVANGGSVFKTIWSEVEGAMAKVIDKVTFEDIANKSRRGIGAANYQI